MIKVGQQKPGAKSLGEDCPSQQHQSADSALLPLLAKDKYVAGGSKKQEQGVRGSPSIQEEYAAGAGRS